MSHSKDPVWSYPHPLETVRLVGRRKRFFADVRRSDELLTVHCANPGRMTSCGEAGSLARISDSGNPRRKLRWSLEQVAVGGTWIMVNTARANHVVEALLTAGRLPGVPGDAPWRREVADGAGHRFDFRVEPVAAPPLWIEVKNVTLRVGEEARFPDAVTARGTRHLHGLVTRVAAGDAALLVFHVGRSDVTRLRPAHDIDPVYAAALSAAAQAGVRVVALAGEATAEGLHVEGTLPIAYAAPRHGAPGT